jgi:NAD(P)-dependent dehydrogenase (short-subunit alcohol dehydrogenase family)
VTGGTGGIGAAVAHELARRGHRVSIVGRDGERAAAVLRRLEGTGHTFIRADLALMSETTRIAEEITRHSDRLDALVLCAGVLSTVAEWTGEGLERTLALNYLSRYLLVRRLLPALTGSPSGRIVLVANAGRYRDTLDLDDLQLRRRGGRGLRVSGRTQFANDLLAVELAERTRDTPVAVTCVYPGLVATEVFADAHGPSRPVRAVAAALQRRLGAAPATAAAVPAHLAADPAGAGFAGAFVGPRMRRIRIPDRARRPDRRAALWATSERLVHPWLTDTDRRHA